MARRERRRSRALTSWSPGFLEELNTRIAGVVKEWHALHAAEMTPEASHQMFMAEYLRRLQDCKGTLDAAHIVEFARNGHGAAAAALDRLIELAVEHGTLGQLPHSVQGYIVWARKNAPDATPDYPPNASAIIDNFIRDIAIYRLVNRVVEIWPIVPPLRGSDRYGRSAADMVGKPFLLGEAQTRRIYNDHKDVAPAFVAFMRDYRGPGAPGSGPLLR